MSNWGRKRRQAEMGTGAFIMLVGGLVYLFHTPPDRYLAGYVFIVGFAIWNSARVASDKDFDNK